MRHPAPIARDSRVVALDAMGGDRAPDAACEAAATISRDTAIRLRLAGDPARLEPLLARHGADLSRIDLVPAPDAIPMAEDPRAAATRTHSSLALTLAELAAGRAEAAVSAGNTGALVLHAARLLPRLPGVRRAALAAVYPARPRPHNPDPFALLLDVGANVTCEPGDLAQFALMGSAYASRISRVAQPSVGLLNIGAEPHKGDRLLCEAHALLAHTPGIHFVGNVEGTDVPLGLVDVVVCPGVLGNVVLKLLESLGELARARGEAVFAERLSWRLGRRLLRGGLRALSDVFDYASYGGAPILGLERLVIKAHGRSRARSLENAVKLAAKAVRDDVAGTLARRLAAQAAAAGGSEA